MQDMNMIFAQATPSAAPVVQTTQATQVPTVPAGTPAQQQGNPLMTLVPFVLIIIVFYFLMIRPQQKQRKEHEAMLGQLKAGDRVITNSGIYGTVASVSDKTVMVRVDGNVVLEMARGAVAGKIEEEKK